MPNFLLPKSNKIRKSFEFLALNRLKKRVYGSHISLDYRYNNSLEMPRIGITLSSKLAKAHIRNRFKRIIREIFRLNKHLLSKNMEINILARTLDRDLNYFEIERDFLNLISKIKESTAAAVQPQYLNKIPDKQFLIFMEKKSFSK